MKSAFKSIVQTSVHFMLSPLESIMLENKGYGSIPLPIFILGAPRSGTTLLYELLVNCYEFSYFTNFANTFYNTPLTVSKFGAQFKRNWYGNQESRFGTISGLGAPSEAGSIWGRWIPEFNYLDENDAEERSKHLADLVRVIKALQLIQGAPFINKNVMHCVHIRFLDAVFPNCLFIDLRREKKANVRSIIRAREQKGGPMLDADGWWSVRPRNVESWCGLSIEEQACAQVSLLHKNIDESFRAIGEDRRIMINYEDICLDPESILEKVRKFLISKSLDIQKRHPFPVSFNKSPSVPFASEVEELIELTLVKLEEN